MRGRLDAGHTRQGKGKDTSLAHLALYLHLSAELVRDALHDPASRAQLLADGGKIQVPCLQITDAQGNATWMYESSNIIQYLQQEYA